MKGKWLLEPNVITLVDLPKESKRQYTIRHLGIENMPHAWWQLYVDGKRLEGWNRQPMQFERGTSFVVDAHSIEIFGINYSISGAWGEYQFEDEELYEQQGEPWRLIANTSFADQERSTPIINLDEPALIRVVIETISPNTTELVAIPADELRTPPSSLEQRTSAKCYVKIYVDGKAVTHKSTQQDAIFFQSNSVDLYGKKIEIGVVGSDANIKFDISGVFIIFKGIKPTEEV